MQRHDLQALGGGLHEFDGVAVLVGARRGVRTATVALALRLVALFVVHFEC